MPIFRHHITFNNSTVSKTVPSTNSGEAYSSPWYPNGYKTTTDSYSNYERNPNILTDYGTQYINRVFFNNLTYPYMTYQYCTEQVTLFATSGSWYSYYSDRTSALSLLSSVTITVKIYGAY